MHTLNLYGNENITDEGIQNLTNIQNLNLYGYGNEKEHITDKGIKNLTNIHTLELGNNKKITNEGIKNLIKINTLCLQQH